jgi:hypothetical protein
LIHQELKLIPPGKNEAALDGLGISRNKPLFLKQGVIGTVGHPLSSTPAEDARTYTNVTVSLTCPVSPDDGLNDHTENSLVSSGLIVFSHWRSTGYSTGVKIDIAALGGPVHNIFDGRYEGAPNCKQEYSIPLVTKAITNHTFAIADGFLFTMKADLFERC